MDIWAFQYGVPLHLRIVLGAGLLVPAVAVILALRVGLGWYRREWSLATRVYLTILALAACTLALVLDHWNAIGFRY
jgi:hypothetical protein